MRINLREGSLEATRTESGATLLRFRLITEYDEQKIRDAQDAALKAKQVAAERVAELATYDAADPEQTARLAGILERAESELDRCYHLQPTGQYFCLEGKQIAAAVKMLRGTFQSPVGECGLADGYRHIRFDKEGVRIYESAEQADIAFPGTVLANAIEALMNNLKTLGKYGIARTVNEAHPSGKAQSFSTDLALTREFVRDLEKGYAPWTEWAYSDYTDIEGYPPMYRKISEDRQDARVSDQTLTQALDSLTRVAESYSNGKVGDGKPVLIHLSYDSRPRTDEPASYYFWIETADGKRGMNGGVIAHQKYAKGSAGNAEDRIPEWNYSTHT